MLSVAGLVGVHIGGGSGSVLLWAILLGLGQGGQLSLALSLVNLRSRDAAAAADLSTMVQSIGYLIAALGPIIVGAVHGATADWTGARLALLLALMIPLAACGWVGGARRIIGVPDSGAIKRSRLGGYFFTERILIANTRVSPGSMPAEGCPAGYPSSGAIATPTDEPTF